MIKFENTKVIGWEHAIRGMRNPMNSWEKSDSGYCDDISCVSCPLYTDAGFFCDDAESDFIVGNNDHDLMMRLAKGGPVHAKYRRMIAVYVDITAPLYWWKEFDTYKVGTVANSCSTMHKIAAKEFTLEDFSCEHLLNDHASGFQYPIMKFQSNEYIEDEEFLTPLGLLGKTIEVLNVYRKRYLETKDKKYWWQMIQLLPSSYNQKRTVMLNYEVLAGIYQSRKNHKLDEWRVHTTPKEHEFRNKDFTSGMWGFCDWIESLPYSGIITGMTEQKKGEE